MSYMPLTLIIVLTSSLFVALVIVPVIFIVFYKKGANTSLPNPKMTLIVAGILLVLAALFFIGGTTWLGTLFVVFAIIGLLNLAFLSRLAMWFQKVALVWLENTYLKFIRFGLRKSTPYLLIAGTFVLMFITIIFYFSSNPKVEFFPSSDPKLINVLVETPISTDIEVTDSVMHVIEKKVFELLDPNIDLVSSLLTITGKGAVGQNEGFTGRGGGSNKGIITINFVDFEERGDVSTLDILDNLADNLVGAYPGVIIEIEKQREGAPTGKQINLEISGKDFKTLLYLTDTIRAVFNDSDIEGIEGLQIDLDVGKPELLVNIDREKARRYGLSTGQIGEAIRTALFGKEISDFKDGENEYKIRMKPLQYFQPD